MKVLFCVPAQDQEGLLKAKLAGLHFWERLYHHAKKAGMHPVFVIRKESALTRAIPPESVATNFNDLPCQSTERVVVSDPSFLPTVDCLKRLSQTSVSEAEFMDLGGCVLFLPSKGCFELERLFGAEGFQRLKDFLPTFLRPVRARCEKGELLPVGTEKERKKTQKLLFKALIKETEGFMSRYVERPISLFISKRLAETSITPNQITVISTIIGLVGAFFISLGQGFWQVAGALLFLAHSIIDGCDGEIARIKFMESKLGGVLDFWGDNLVHAAVFWAIGLEWAMRTGSTYPLYLGAAAVFGTLLSASIVYFSTMTKAKEGPLYTSVSDSSKKGRVVKIADFLSRRDFIYLVVILAFFNHLDWFLVAASIGSIIFAGILLWIRLRG